MKPEFEYKGTKDYITHVYIGAERIIPSESFDLGENEYLLLEILKSTEDQIFLRLISLHGDDLGKTYLVPKNIFEEKNAGEIKELLADYRN